MRSAEEFAAVQLSIPFWWNTTMRRWATELRPFEATHRTHLYGSKCPWRHWKFRPIKIFPP